jgi:hypothetical protein
MTARRLAVLLATSLLLAGCGGGGDDPFDFDIISDDAPMVSEFQIQPLTPTVTGGTVRWRITARVTDRNGDVVGGEAIIGVARVNGVGRASTTGGTFRSRIDETELVGDRLTVQLFIVNPPPGEIDLVFIVSDAGDHPSGFVFPNIGGVNFTVTVSGPSRPGQATRPEDIVGGVTSAAG